MKVVHLAYTHLEFASFNGIYNETSTYQFLSSW